MPRPKWRKPHFTQDKTEKKKVTHLQVDHGIFQRRLDDPPGEGHEVPAHRGRAVEVEQLLERQPLRRGQAAAEEAVQEVEDVPAEALVGRELAPLLLGLLKQFLGKGIDCLNF